jgi:UDP-N-acetylmuramoyl-L-alanyl-D-glutamate--2,6-diaminopimelate ligase
MQWKDLAEEVTAVGAGGDSAEPIAGIEYDSRKVRPGSVFVAMKGGSTDGNRYVEKAIASGALGIITDSAHKFDHLLVFQAGLPVLEVEHGRRALAQASAAFFGHPERKLSPPPASPEPTAKPPPPSSPRRCSTPPLAKPFSSAPSSTT